MTVLPEAIESNAAQGLLVLRWPDGEVSRFTHAQLRAACPCSECRARGRAGEPVGADEQIRVVTVEPVGAYGLNLAFTDGHRRGIYPFELLAELGRASCPT